MLERGGKRKEREEAVNFAWVCVSVISSYQTGGGKKGEKEKKKRKRYPRRRFGISRHESRVSFCNLRLKIGKGKEGKRGERKEKRGKRGSRWNSYLITIYRPFAFGIRTPGKKGEKKKGKKGRGKKNTGGLDLCPHPPQKKRKKNKKGEKKKKKNTTTTPRKFCIFFQQRRKKKRKKKKEGGKMKTAAGPPSISFLFLQGGGEGGGKKRKRGRKSVNARGLLFSIKKERPGKGRGKRGEGGDWGGWKTPVTRNFIITPRKGGREKRSEKKKDDYIQDSYIFMEEEGE